MTDLFTFTAGLVSGMLISMVVCWLNGGSPEPPQGDT